MERLIVSSKSIYNRVYLIVAEFILQNRRFEINFPLGILHISSILLNIPLSYRVGDEMFRYVEYSFKIPLNSEEHIE